MSLTIQEIRCHTCGAPARNLDSSRSEFRCSWCGTLNRVTATLETFVERNREFFSAPSEHAEILAGLVHTTDRIRSYTSRQIQKLTNRLDQFEIEEDRISTRFRPPRKKKGRTFEWHVSSPERSYRLSIVFLTIALFLLLVRGVLIPDEATARMVGVAAGLGLVFGGPLFRVVGPAAIGLMIATGPLISILSGIALLLIALRVRVNKAEKPPEAPDPTPQLRKEALEAHTREAQNVIDEEWTMISEIRNFLKLRKEFKRIESDIPIGLRMDHAIASLNDIRFSSIVDDLSECARLVRKYMKRYDLQTPDLAKSHPAP